MSRSSFTTLLFVLVCTTASHAQMPTQPYFGGIAAANAKPELFSDISFGGFDLLSANLKYSKEDNLQKIAFSPFKLIDKSSLLNDTRINFTQKDAISTIGIGWGLDNSNAFTKLKRPEKIFKTLTIPSKRAKLAGETDEQYEDYVKNDFTPKLNQARIDFLKAMAKNSFSFRLGYNISLFELVGGDKVKNADSLVTNKYALKANTYSLDLNYGFNEDFGISGGFSYAKKRQSAVENQKMIDYYGFNASISYRAIYLKKDADLKADSDYLKSFFIPSIIIGCSYEYQKAKGDKAYYQDGIQYQSVITPFIDFRISTKSQFRLGVPIKRYYSYNKDLVGLGPFVQYSLSLANTQ